VAACSTGWGVRRVQPVFPPGRWTGHQQTEADLAGLPSSVQRYLRFIGVTGRPRDWSFRARFAGRFRIRPGMGCLPAEAWQYNSAVTVSRVFMMRVCIARVFL
jgi:hypothetical protein